MTLGRLGVACGAVLASAARWRYDPWPEPGAVAALDLVAAVEPGLHAALRVWHLAGPACATLVGGSLALSLWDVWGPRRAGGGVRSALPRWPDAGGDEPQLVVGEQHHPVDAVEVAKPTWLTLPAQGLFAGVAIFGAVGTGKTAGCMRPFAQQLLGWRAKEPDRRAAGLVLEVKGDFCAQVGQVLKDAGRGGDYLPLGLGGPWSWNPLDAPEMDAYSLAYQMASLLNQLFGKGKEPFWQQAYTNLLKRIIDLHRLPPRGGWVTLRDLHAMAIDAEAFAAGIEEAVDAVGRSAGMRAVIASAALRGLPAGIRRWRWRDAGEGRVAAEVDAGAVQALREAEVEFDLAAVEDEDSGEQMQRVVDLRNWFSGQWIKLDPKLRTSIVEGITSFLGLFEDPAIARIFCPPAPGADPGRGGPAPLPRLRELIEDGRVVALAMSSASNPALARAIGTMLKNAWLQAALSRTADMARPEAEGRWWRPAAFICDEYQAFATVGENDPTGDEKSFALTRQARVIPIVATQSISSLRSATGGGDAWRTLLQCFRTRLFLSMADADSCKIAQDLCGTVERMKASHSVSESGGRGGVDLVSGALTSAKGGVGASKNYSLRREARFDASRFALLDGFQAIAQPFDGQRSLPPRLCYLKPHFLPRRLGWWHARRAGRL